LVADQPEMILTHAANAPAWGVKSAKITASYEFGPVVEAVEIKLDDTAGDMLRQFTQKYVGHSMAVVLGGQVIMNATLLTPVRRSVLQLRFPENEKSEAERLRDALMK
jgi:preprotein translocase subunit SecD